MSRFNMCFTDDFETVYSATTFISIYNLCTGSFLLKHDVLKTMLGVIYRAVSKTMIYCDLMIDIYRMTHSGKKKLKGSGEYPLTGLRNDTCYT